MIGVALCYSSENWLINRRDAPKLEAAQIRFLRPLLGLARCDTVILNGHVPRDVPSLQRGKCVLKVQVQTKAERTRVFRPTAGYESLQEISNDNSLRQRNQIVKAKIIRAQNGGSMSLTYQHTGGGGLASHLSSSQVFAQIQIEKSESNIRFNSGLILIYLRAYSTAQRRIKK
jgi:hypothetical protein